MPVPRLIANARDRLGPQTTLLGGSERLHRGPHSVPTAYLLGKLFRGIDIREHGSGS